MQVRLTATVPAKTFLQDSQAHNLTVVLLFQADMKPTLTAVMPVNLFDMCMFYFALLPLHCLGIVIHMIYGIS